MPTVSRTYKYKLSPTKDQEVNLDFFLKQTTFVYNGFLKMNEKKPLTLKEMFKFLPKLKSKFPILNKIPKKILDACIINAMNDTKNISPLTLRKTERGGMFSCLQGFSLDKENKLLHLPGIENIHVFLSRDINEKINYIEIWKKHGEWYLYVTFQETFLSRKISDIKSVGIDVGLKEFAILSSGRKIPNPRYYRGLEEKLIKEQRKLARKKKDSENWNKQLRKVQKVHRQIVDYRMNFLHKISTYLVMNYDIIGIEKLHIQGMVKNKKFTKSILDAGWATFIKMLKYKAYRMSKKVIEVERFYPSSQLCSKCGSKQLMPLHLRTFICKKCNHTIDRDYNASLNIEKRALELAKK